MLKHGVPATKHDLKMINWRDIAKCLVASPLVMGGNVFAMSGERWAREGSAYLHF
jgi:hypothetical protein